ncbi:IclR family transcriptional regulator [Amycolatopsis thermoflava]|uniref:IclR family transcriptional regulator n=1 Tax=Amycolatopsis tucumanensis TaxID=401106 RepID=A0ABP7HHU5_9PSEU|nr:IclR family transcriptional regulator [Amycolatopsis tucumanensis]MCF6427021.1 IclR family transcriptional regulator [Amycolatopsis tucumanensis]
MTTGPDHLGDLLQPENRAAPAYPIASVDNTLRILLLLRDRGTLTLADVATELGIVRSSAHRLMAMLTYYDFVRQSPVDRSFRMGPALIDVGLAAARALDIRALARPILTTLAESTGMTAHLVLPRGREVLFADGVESRRTIRAALRTGTTLPAHVTGAGKALLATLTDDQLRRLYADTPPEALTDRSLSSLTALLREVTHIRRAGYAINDGESETGVLAMGIACVVPEADIRAGLGVSGPASTTDDSWEARITHALQDAAAELAKQVQTYHL